MMCQWEAAPGGVRCTICGALRPNKRSRNCDGPDCDYLGGQRQRRGVAIRVKCLCGGGERQQWHTAHRCEVHGRCLPTLRPRGDDLANWLERPEARLYRLCQGCPDFSTIESKATK